MKKLQQNIPNGGAPLGQFPVLREIFDEENKNAIESIVQRIVQGRAEGVILSGCEVSGTASDWDISEGYVYIDNEVLKFDGIVGATTGVTIYIEKAPVTNEGGVFADGLTKNYIDVNKAQFYLISGGGISTQKITITFTQAGETLRDAIINDDSIYTAAIQDLSVTTAKINDLGVTTAKIADSSVTNNKVANSVAISTTDLFSGDLDTLTRPQIRSIDGSATNKPAGYSGLGIMTVSGISGGFLVQQLMSSTTGIVYSRNKTGASAFTAWVSNTA